MTEKITSRRWLGSAVVTVLLALGLMVTTLAIALSVAERPDDIFSTMFLCNGCHFSGLLTSADRLIQSAISALFPLVQFNIMNQTLHDFSETLLHRFSHTT